MRTFRSFVMLTSTLLLSSVLLLAQSNQAQVPSPLSLEVRPAFDMPLGDSSQWFSYGGAVDLGLNYELPRSMFYLLGGLSTPMRQSWRALPPLWQCFELVGVSNTP